MTIPRKVMYAGEAFYLQSSGRYYQSGRKNVAERLLHRRIWIDRNGPIPEGYVVHHKNGDWQDDSPENLCLEASSEHALRHITERYEDPAFRAASLYHLEQAQAAAKAWHSSPEGLEWHKKHGKKTWEGRKPVQALCERCHAPFETYFPSRARFCSHACEQAVGYQRHKTATGVCEWCGASFTYNKYRQQRCCSRLCANQRRGAMATEENQ